MILMDITINSQSNGQLKIIPIKRYNRGIRSK